MTPADEDTKRILTDNDNQLGTNATGLLIFHLCYNFAIVHWHLKQWHLGYASLFGTCSICLFCIIANTTPKKILMAIKERN